MKVVWNNDWNQYEHMQESGEKVRACAACVLLLSSM